MHWSIKIGIGLGLLLVTILSIDTLSREGISKSNTVFINGTFSSLKKHTTSNKWSISYNIQIQENNISYKIFPDWVDCFDSTSFKIKVSKGDSITIITNKDNGMRSKDVPQVVSLIANKYNFISTNCINEENKNSKIITLSICFFLALVLLVYFIKSRTD